MHAQTKRARNGGREALHAGPLVRRHRRPVVYLALAGKKEGANKTRVAGGRPPRRGRVAEAQRRMWRERRRGLGPSAWWIRRKARGWGCKKRHPATKGREPSGEQGGRPARRAGEQRFRRFTPERAMGPKPEGGWCRAGRTRGGNNCPGEGQRAAAHRGGPGPAGVWARCRVAWRPRAKNGGWSGRPGRHPKTDAARRPMDRQCHSGVGGCCEQRQPPRAQGAPNGADAAAAGRRALGTTQRREGPQQLCPWQGRRTPTSGAACENCGGPGTERGEVRVERVSGTTGAKVGPM